MDRIKLAASIVAAVLAIIVFAQNWKEVDVYFLFMELKLPNTILLLLTFALGFVGGWGFTWWRGRRH